MKSGDIFELKRMQEEVLDNALKKWEKIMDRKLKIHLDCIGKDHCKSATEEIKL